LRNLSEYALTLLLYIPFLYLFREEAKRKVRKVREGRMKEGER
jgi:hypothetical protein